MIDVVCVLLIQRKRVLVAKRPLGKSFGGGWEFPGGKVEPGESRPQALVRELQEELKLEINNSDLLPLGCTNGDTIQLHAFLCDKFNFFSPTEHSALAWSYLSELPLFNLCPTDLALVKKFNGAIQNFIEAKSE